MNNSEQNLGLLRAEWQKYFDTEPYTKASRVFLSKNIKWQKQAKEQGINLNKFYKFMDAALAKTVLGKKHKIEVVVKSGTKLIRSFKGKKYEVLVIEKGFLYNNKTYGSPQ